MEINLKNFVSYKRKIEFIKDFGTFIDCIDKEVFVVEGKKGNVVEVHYETAKILVEMGYAIYK